MPKNILILSANPNANSFNHALAQTYLRESQSAGHKATLVHIASLDFDYNLEPGSALEPALKQQQQLITQADTVVLCFPIWWYGPPANLKAYFERTLTPGFAYKYPHPWPLVRIFIPRRLLKGKRVRIITTQDSFRFVAWAMGLPISWSLRVATLWYVGFWPIRHTRFARVRGAVPATRSRWHTKIARLAARGR